MPEQITEDNLTVHEAVKLTGYSRETIYRAIWNEKLRHVKRRIGRLTFYLIDKKSLIDYCEKNGRGAVDGKPARSL